MNQDQPPQPWWKDNRLVWVVWALAALTLTGLVITTILGYWLKWAWTELLWRWLQLLIIPLVLALGALWFNNQTRKSEQELAQDRAREEALQRYLDRIQELILDKGLGRAEIRAVSRARTLTVLKSLDVDRKAQVVRFLYEADLIGKVVKEESRERQVIEAIIDLGRADLKGVNLSFTDLSGVDLSGANLSGANLSYSYLVDANLSYMLLSNIVYSSVGRCFTIPRGATPQIADLFHADLRGANLTGTDEFCVLMQLAEARSLVGATMPDGKVMTEEDWEAFKERYYITEEGWENIKKFSQRGR